MNVVQFTIIDTILKHSGPLSPADFGPGGSAEESGYAAVAATEETIIAGGSSALEPPSYVEVASKPSTLDAPRFKEAVESSVGGTDGSIEGGLRRRTSSLGDFEQVRGQRSDGEDESGSEDEGKLTMDARKR